ncbi:Plant invertase/pectin methylesterase inhibitor superfamily protein [Striga hermonthica]|uniref:Plant invertase/pectin methylesterase inhibitor superfamily protein n=1 Tax=Striga hermonthica TaxID=68872 RepID=A0A9N7NPI0_STRHE|nr:Plant invertase/pectin methylesterase inhibitor superfamily protein [Striga hermonthica]
MEDHASKSVAITALTLLTLIYSAAAAGGGSTQFIRRSCSATTYPALCYSTLSSHASAVQQSPQLLAHAALSVSLDTARATSADMVRISRRAGLTARESGAMADCVELLGDTVDQIRKSLAEMNGFRGGPGFEAMVSDVQTWVSAALTNEETCTDGFAGASMNGAVKEAVRERIVNAAHVTSNALALINSYAAVHG